MLNSVPTGGKGLVLTVKSPFVLAATSALTKAVGTILPIEVVGVKIFDFGVDRRTSRNNVNITGKVEYRNITSSGVGACRTTRAENRG